MTDARQIALFADCPYGGCEDGYCACLEQDVDPDDLQPELDLCGEMYAVRRFRRIETVPISIDEYPPEGARP